MVKFYESTRDRWRWTLQDPADDKPVVTNFLHFKTEAEARRNYHKAVELMTPQPRRRRLFRRLFPFLVRS